MYEYNINKPLPNNIISILSVIISVFTLAVSIVKEFKASVFINNSYKYYCLNINLSCFWH